MCPHRRRRTRFDPGQNGGTAGQAATLAHIVLHEPGAAAVDTGVTTAHCRGEREVEAESTAIVVAEAWGLDTSQMSLPYIADWLSEVPDADAAVRRVGTGSYVLRTRSRSPAETTTTGR